MPDEMFANVLEHEPCLDMFEAFWSDPENYATGKEAVEAAVEGAVECFESRRGIVNFAGHHLDRRTAHAEVRMIARWGARLVLGMQKNLARGDLGEGANVARLSPPVDQVEEEE